jgi:hypothetical protein
MTFNEIKCLFEREYSAAFEGDFAEYANGEYVNEHQQDFFDGFKGGIKTSETTIATLRARIAELEATKVSMQRWIDHHNERADIAESKLTAPPSEGEIESAFQVAVLAYAKANEAKRCPDHCVYEAAKAAIETFMDGRR